PSPIVRLYLASGMQRLPLKQRWDVMTNLVAHGEDVSDPNLPLMNWYAAEPLAEVDSGRALELAKNSKIPLLLPFMVRRVGSCGTPEALALLVQMLVDQDHSDKQAEILGAIKEGLKGRHQVEMPKKWPEALAKLSKVKDASVRNQALALSVTFGDPDAFEA